MANTQFLGRTAYTLATGTGTLLALPAPSLAEQTVTGIFESADAGCLLCADEDGNDVVLVLPTVAGGQSALCAGRGAGERGAAVLGGCCGHPGGIIC